MKRFETLAASAKSVVAGQEVGPSWPVKAASAPGDEADASGDEDGDD